MARNRGRSRTPSSEFSTPPKVSDTDKRARVRGEKGSHQNRLRGSLYKEAFERISRASENGYYFEVVALCDSILEDRLEAFLQVILHHEMDQYPTNSTGLAVTTLLAEAKKNNIEWHKSHSKLFGAILAWTGQRNIALHQFVIVQQNNKETQVEDRLESVRKAAEDGFDLVRQVTSLSPSIIGLIKSHMSD